MHFLGKKVKLFTSGDSTVVSVLVLCNEKAGGTFFGSLVERQILKEKNTFLKETVNNRESVT